MTQSNIVPTNNDPRSSEQRWSNSRSIDTLIRKRSLLPVFQTIHEVSNMAICGYEFLARSDIAGAMTPKQMFAIAKECGRSTIVELSQLCRECGVQYASEIGLEAPIYLNTHPTEDLLDEVLPHLKILRQRYGENRWVLELHEDLLLNPYEIARIAMRLETLNIELALDDVGSGQDRINVICQARIGIVKLCRSLFKTTDSTQVLMKLVSLIQSSGAVVIAEGIETLEELSRCQEVGIEFAQGFYLGKPSLLFAE